MRRGDAARPRLQIDRERERCGALIDLAISLVMHHVSSRACITSAMRKPVRKPTRCMKLSTTGEMPLMSEASVKSTRVPTLVPRSEQSVAT